MDFDKRTPSPDAVEQYRRQLLELYRRQPAPTAAATPDGEGPDKPDDGGENWLDERFPPPDIPRDRAALTPPQQPQNEPAEPERPAIVETPYIGYLRVFVFTGDGALPLEDTLVTVTRDGVIYANTVTDRDGYTQVIPLPAGNPELSFTPGGATPYRTYDIEISRPGYGPVRHENVPVYGNNYVTQPVALLPLLPGESPDAVRDFTSGGPANL